MEHVDNQSLKVVFPFLKGRCHGNQFLLALSTELSVDEIWQVVSNATDSLDASKPITTTKLIKLTSDPAGRVNVSLSPASTLCAKNKTLGGLSLITSPNVNRFSIFAGKLGSKFATNSCLNIPLILKHVATLPCKI